MGQRLGTKVASSTGQLKLQPSQKHLNGFCADGGETSWANIDKIFKPKQMEQIQNKCQESCQICTAFLPKEVKKATAERSRNPKVELFAQNRVVEMHHSGKLFGRALNSGVNELVDTPSKKIKSNATQFDVYIDHKKRLRCVTRFRVKTSSDGKKWQSVQSEKLFSANLFGGGTVVNHFSKAVPSRYVRVLVNEWTKFPALRAGAVVDCASLNAGHSTHTTANLSATLSTAKNTSDGLTAKPTAVPSSASGGYTSANLQDLLADVESDGRFKSDENVPSASALLSSVDDGDDSE